MSETPSSMVPLGTSIPTFTLPDATGKMWEVSQNMSGTLVVFMCNHCPYVIHVAQTLASLHDICKKNGIEMVGINSNDIQTYPEDSPENMVLAAKEHGWEFPYLFDESQEVAKKFNATCTPDAFLFDSSGMLIYRGELDETRPNCGISDGISIHLAILSMLNGKPLTSPQNPAVGCNIKWK
ncbi:MAG: thioredoxin family protein [Phycisphaerales bacterium]|jgi:peroxiredoxin|nr:thioredoxin family protein [Phycisphaerales bacterium]